MLLALRCTVFSCCWWYVCASLRYWCISILVCVNRELTVKRFWYKLCRILTNLYVKGNDVSGVSLTVHPCSMRFVELIAKRVS